VENIKIDVDDLADCDDKSGMETEYTGNSVTLEGKMMETFRISISLLVDLFLVLYRDRVEESLNDLEKAKVEPSKMISTFAELMMVPAMRECFQWFNPESMDEHDCRWVENMLEKVVRIPMESIDDLESGAKWKKCVIEMAKEKEEELQVDVIERMMSSISSSISETRSRLE
jgi:hypothetical protein